MNRKYLFLLTIFVFSLASISTAQTTAGYPSRPIRVLVPYPPGGGTDIIARTVTTRLAANLKQQIVIDNRGGGGGNVAHELAARAAPDGYTLLVAISALVTNPAVNPRSTYNPVRDFTPLMLIARSPYRVVIFPGVPANTIQEWVALAKARPGSMNYGSAGSGSAIHLAAELFRMQAGISMVHVPYKGTGPAITDLIAGQIQMIFAGTLSAAPHVKSGRIRALAVTSLKRRADAPDLPTLAETVAPGYEAGEWFSVFAPAGLPKPLIDKLHGELVKTVNDAELKERLIASGMDFVGSTPAELGEVIQRDFAKWTRLVKETGLKAD
ncbi:MAG TPA: tripartite tricarboxylate transporter substrate binding protein [Burkholderiales bacterium]|nr:tripartite tricarboxylate transporter substrate binding protein [Burkholderiales bacterium]